MGTTNYGDQTLNFDYRNPGTSQSFNQINYQLHLGGVYDGGLLTKIDNSTVEIAPLTCYIEDPNLELGVRVSTANAQQKSVNTSNIFLVLRMIWINTENNYMDMLAIPDGSIQTGDLILGRCVFDGGTLTGFDYSRRNDATIVTSENNESKFKINPQEPPTSTIAVNAGDATIDGVYVEFAGDTIVLTDTTLGRIDLLYIDSSGTLGKIEGVDSGSPVEPDWNSNVLILGRITRGATSTFVTGDQIVNFISDRPFYKIPSITSVTSGYTALSTDDLILANGTFTIDLSASASSLNLRLKIKNIGIGKITIDANSTELIDLNQTIDLNQNDSIEIINDGSQWHIVSKYTQDGIMSTITGDLVLADSDKISSIISNASDGMNSITLPVSANNTGRVIEVFQDVDGITKIIGAGGEFINGQNIWYLYSSSDIISLISDGTGWRIKKAKLRIRTGMVNSTNRSNVHLGQIEVDYASLLNGPFTVGSVVTGGTTGATGIIIKDNNAGVSGTLTLIFVTNGGIFQNTEAITENSPASTLTASVNEPSGDNKNQNTEIIHNLTKNIGDLSYRVIISTDGTDNNSLDPFTSSGDNSAAARNLGVTVYQIDSETVQFQTGNTGLLYNDASGAGQWVDTDDWYDDRIVEYII